MQFTLLLISGLAVGCIYSLVAVGFSMIYRALGLVNFAQSEIMMLGAFVGYVLLKVLPGTPFLLVLVLAACITGVLGLIIERLAFRKAVQKNADQVQLVLLTLGIGMVLSNGARLIWGADPVVYSTPMAHQVYQVFGYPLPAVFMYIGATMLVLLVGLQWFFSRTWVGLAVRAAADDRETASTMGISVGLASGVSFAVAAATGALAGVLYAPITYVSYDMGAVGVKAFAAAVIGTLGSIPGAVVGGLIIGVAEAFGGAYISNAYVDSIAFAIMIGILLIRPHGLFSRGTRS